MKLQPPTAAQTVALHTIESAGLSVVLTVVVGIGQYIATNGLNLPALAAFAGALFIGSMGMVYKSLSTNPAVIAGVTDTVNEARAAIQEDVQALTQALSGSGGQPIASAQLIAAPAQLDAVAVADTILQHLDLSQVAQGLARELGQIRVPSPQTTQSPVPQRPNAMQPMQPRQPQQPFRAG